MSTNVFSQVETLLELVERPSRYINHEWGASVLDPNADYRACMMYPDTYEVGQANQGLAILYSILNAQEGVSCERAYTPWIDMADYMRALDIPLYGLESGDALKDFDLIGIQYPHEMAVTNILESLDLAQIPLFSKERSLDDPLIIAGGPSVLNPEPIADFFDCVLIGESEEQIIKFVDAHRKALTEGLSREDMLFVLSQVPGVYVPQFYAELPKEEQSRAIYAPIKEGVPEKVKRQIVTGFKNTDPLASHIVPYTATVHDRVAIEILRGCSRGCRFCQAGMAYRPVRERTADQIVSAVLEGLKKTGYDEVSLTSLSTTDHSQIEEILTRLNKRLANTGVRISLPSQRMDSFGVEMAALVSGSKKGGLTFAPEAGSQRLRNVINKNITEEDIEKSIEGAFKAGWRRIKLYFMIGLPSETDDDLRAIGELAQRAYEIARDNCEPSQRSAIQITCSAAIFVPKSHTPYQWFGQVHPDEIKRRIEVLKESMPQKGVRLNYHASDTSYLEAVLARGDRSLAQLIYEVWKRGARFDAWTEQAQEKLWFETAEELGFNLLELACKSYGYKAPLPWAHIDSLVLNKYLEMEDLRSKMSQITEDCTFGLCTYCGVCTRTNADIDLAGDRLVE